jgi:hypothetical protein
MFREEVGVSVGDIVERDGFVFADLLERKSEVTRQ